VRSYTRSISSSVLPPARLPTTIDTGTRAARCRITGVDRIEHLIASHCKPWRDSDDTERLDGENGLLLTLSIDHRMGVPVRGRHNVGRFSEGQRSYLEFHRERVFLASSVGRER
jgi:hypothetical protein